MVPLSKATLIILLSSIIIQYFRPYPRILFKMPHKQSLQVRTETMKSTSGTPLWFTLQGNNVTTIQYKNGKTLTGTAKAKLDVYNQYAQYQQPIVCGPLVLTTTMHKPRKAIKANKKTVKKQRNAPVETTLSLKNRSNDSLFTPKKDELAELIRTASIGTIQNDDTPNLEVLTRDLSKFDWDSRTNSTGSCVLGPRSNSDVSDSSLGKFNFDIPSRLSSFELT